MTKKGKARFVGVAELAEVMQLEHLNAPKQSTDCRTAIEEWYRRAGQTLGTIRHLATYSDKHLVHAVAFHHTDGEGPSPQQIRRHFETLLTQRKALANQLRSAAEQILADLGWLRSITNEPLWSRIRLAYCELGDFCAGGYSGGRCAWTVLEPMGYDMRGWAVELAAIWDTTIIDAANVELAELFENKRSACPFTTAIDNALRQRFFLEESRLLRDLVTEVPFSRIEQTTERFNSENKTADAELADVENSPQLTKTEWLAYQVYRKAEAIAGKQLTPKDAFEIVREMSDEDLNGYEPVSVDALERMDRRARKKKGELRREFKAGVVTRSIERLSDRE